ncbi:MAG: TonB-dependent receptor plug domain-containing protein, partial [Gemmatimonadota bacterium]
MIFARDTKIRCGPIVGALVVPISLLVAAGDDAIAQVRVHGTVLDNRTEQAIDGANVVVLDQRGRYLATGMTDERGVFDFDVRAEKAIRLRVTRMGYRETLTPLLHLERYEHFGVEVRLDTEAVLLAPLEVVVRTGRRPNAVLDDVRDRLESGSGWYFTRDQIQERAPDYVTDLLGSVPGVHLRSAGRGTRRIVTMSRTAAGQAGGVADCPTQIYVDGFLINRRVAGEATNRSIDDFVSPRAVEAIEVYRGLST